MPSLGFTLDTAQLICHWAKARDDDGSDGGDCSRRCGRYVPTKRLMGVIVHPGRLRQEMTRRGWAATDLAREARLSPATVSAALGGKPIAASSVALIAHALSRVPASTVIDSLIMIERSRDELA